MVMLAAENSKDPYELVDPKFEGHNEAEISYPRTRRPLPGLPDV